MIAYHEEQDNMGKSERVLSDIEGLSTLVERETGGVW